MWKKELSIGKVLFTDFTIELQIKGTYGKAQWWLICGYASSNKAVRGKQWKIITKRKVLWGKNWVLAGDMNDYPLFTRQIDYPLLSFFWGQLAILITFSIFRTNNRFQEKDYFPKTFVTQTDLNTRNSHPK